jgi:hypothetical protein
MSNNTPKKIVAPPNPYQPTPIKAANVAVPIITGVTDMPDAIDTNKNKFLKDVKKRRQARIHHPPPMDDIPIFNLPSGAPPGAAIPTYKGAKRPAVELRISNDQPVPEVPLKVPPVMRRVPNAPKKMIGGKLFGGVKKRKISFAARTGNHCMVKWSKLFTKDNPPVAKKGTEKYKKMKAAYGTCKV